jgi:transposase InsO family protein
MAKHQPGNFWGDCKKIEFTSPRCCEKCTKATANAFSLKMDKSVLDHPEALVIGHIAATTTKEELSEAIQLVPDKFRKWISIMTKEAADRLPDHRPYDHAIDLKEGETPPWGPVYALNETELETLREWLKEMLKTGKIRPSKSPAAAPILFVPKPHGRGLRLCVDYRGINKVTIANRYPLPLMSELQDRVRGARFFTKLDLKNGYHLIRIKEGDEWKTAFRCRYGLYEFLVMPFGLTNAPATFQDMMNHIFRDMLDLGVIAFIDDILIYAETEEEHDKLAEEVLKRLKENSLVVSPEKCVWSAKKVEFLGYVISQDGIEMATDKVESVLAWEPPKSLKETQAFLGFANFYRRFIKDFSRICRPLTESTKGDAKSWQWTVAMELAFDELKKMFTTAPILGHFNPRKECIVETDASDFALGAVLSQRGEDGKLHPVAFHSRKFSPAEINYEIHDKELLAIVDSFKLWRRYLEGAMHTVQVYSDHQNLEYFTTTKVLNRRQARWAQELAGVDFKIYYRPGTKNGKPDALSRRPEYRPEKGGGEDQPITTILHNQHFSGEEARVSSISTGGEGTVYMVSSARLASIPSKRWDEEFLEMVRKAGKGDTLYQQAMTSVKEPLSVEDGVLYRKERMWIPDDKELIKKVLESEHDAKIAGHFGQDKTIELIRRNFWWPKMDEQIIDYVRSCPQCQKDKAARHQKYGLLQPLELPYAPWQSIAMDFITDLPESSGCDQLWVVVDRFTKMAHFIPLQKDGKTTADLVKIFAREIWKLHGLPLDIISDRDSRFTSSTWKVFLGTLGIKPRMSTAFHPQTDGQTERLNQTIEAYLRSFVNHEMNDWVDLLPMAEFAYNNSVTTATGLSPFYANYGYNPNGSNPSVTGARNPASQAYAHWMHTVHEGTKLALEQTRERMRKYADQHRKEAPAYQVGDLVMLDGRNIRTRRPSRKLDHKLHGPFQVEKVISPTAVKLTLPRKWKIHNAFHVSLIEPFRAGTRAPPDTSRVLREADDVEGSEEYDIDEVMSSYKSDDRVLYLVKWLGWPKKKDWTPEPFDNFSVGGLEKLREFHLKYPDSPRDYRLTDKA